MTVPDVFPSLPVPVQIRPIPFWVDLRAFVLEHAPVYRTGPRWRGGDRGIRRRMPKWRFTLADDFVVQVQPKEDTARVFFDVLALEGASISHDAFTKGWSFRLGLGMLGVWIAPGRDAQWMVRTHTMSRDGVSARHTRLLAALTPERFSHLHAVAQFSPNCVICGRGLTDPVSMARYIGSECITKVPAHFRVPGLRLGETDPVLAPAGESDGRWRDPEPELPFVDDDESPVVEGAPPVPVAAAPPEPVDQEDPVRDQEPGRLPSETPTSAARTYPEPWYELGAGAEPFQFAVPDRLLDDPTYPGLRALAIKASRQRLRALAGALASEAVCLWSLGVDEVDEEMHDVLEAARMRDEETETEDEADARWTPYDVKLKAHSYLVEYASVKALETEEEVRLAHSALAACVDERRRRY